MDNAIIPPLEDRLAFLVRRPTSKPADTIQAVSLPPRKRLMNDIIREALKSAAPKRRAKGDSSCDSLPGLEDLLGSNPIAQPQSSRPSVSASHDSQPSSDQLVFDEEGNIVLSTATSGNNTADFSAFDGAVIESGVTGYEHAYKKATQTRWTGNETERFYQGLERFGSDLMLLNTMLPSMSAIQIRQKFKLEDRKNPQKVSAAISKSKSTRSSQPNVGIISGQLPLTALPSIDLNPIDFFNEFTIELSPRVLKPASPKKSAEDLLDDLLRD